MKYLLRVLAFALLSAPHAGAQSDDFDDGDDAGWQRVSPLSGFGLATTYSFPDGKYKLESVANDVNEALGPPRMGSLRADVYTDFYLFVDLFYDESIDQNIGVLTRVKEPGVGTLDGYGITFNPFDGQMFLTVVTDEAGDNIADVDVVVPPDGVRMVVQGKGADLKAELFAFDDLATPIATIEMSDNTYSSGTCGVFVVSDPVDAPIAASFDNYFAAEAEPSRFGLVDARREGGEMVIEYFSKPGMLYFLDEWKDGDAVWTEVDDGLTGELGETSTVRVPITEGDTRMFRIRDFE